MKIFCESCNDYNEMLTLDIRKDELNKHPWGDLVCSECKLVIATIRADIEGTYVFKKYKPLMSMDVLPEWLINNQKKSRSIDDKFLRIVKMSEATPYAISDVIDMFGIVVDLLASKHKDIKTVVEMFGRI